MVHFPSENGVSAAFLICEIAVRPTPEIIESSVALNWRCGNFSARNSNAANVVVSFRVSSSLQKVAAEYLAVSMFVSSEEAD